MLCAQILTHSRGYFSHFTRASSPPCWSVSRMSITMFQYCETFSIFWLSKCADIVAKLNTVNSYISSAGYGFLKHSTSTIKVIEIILQTTVNYGGEFAPLASPYVHWETRTKGCGTASDLFAQFSRCCSWIFEFPSAKAVPLAKYSTLRPRCCVGEGEERPALIGKENTKVWVFSAVMKRDGN